MFKNNTTKDWIGLGFSSLFMLYVGYFASLPINNHIICATQSRLGGSLSRAYIHYILKIDNDTRINGNTPIQYAISNNTPLDLKKIEKIRKTIHVLKDKGVDINATNAFGLTSFHYAIMNEDPLAVQLLIEEKANVNQPVSVENMDQLTRPVQITNMTPLRFLNERKSHKLVKNAEKVAQIEAALLAAGVREIGTSNEIGKPLEAPKTNSKKKK